jgi:hypothetical protein
MKVYNKKTKRWEEPAKLTGQGKFKSRDTCRGKKEHEYILALPDYLRITDDIKPELVEEYYLSEERRNAFNSAEDKKLEALGMKIKPWSSYYREVHRHYRCVVCDKRKYE